MLKKNQFYFLLTALVVAITLSYGCNKDDDNDDNNGNSGSGPTPYTIEIPKGFPTELNIPEDNPMTVEGIKLGGYL